MSNSTIKITIPTKLLTALRKLVKKSGFVDSVSQAGRNAIVEYVERYEGKK